MTSGCALTPKPTLGPDGKPVTFIDGMSASVTYDKAKKFLATIKKNSVSAAQPVAEA